jgi:hypothetical protein
MYYTILYYTILYYTISPVYLVLMTIAEVAKLFK